MNYKIEILNKNKIVYMRNIGAYGNPKNFDMMKDFKIWIAKNNLTKTLLKNGIFGIAQDNPQIIPPEKCRYDLVLATDKDFSKDNKVKSGYFKGESMQ
ncbi:GyrI-like domain-containing protein [Paraliobacillus sp. JSM ZJ581]|uniref:GyrI-like domain-containing protein n=1 Tax=Paraliobacillus sp. JSM ZJ581 TaxID=3342118 RepID=UPI0035A9715B